MAVARAAVATELDRRVEGEQPTTWPEVVMVGVGVARAVLGEEPKRDAHPSVREPEHSSYDQAVSTVFVCKRQAETWEDWTESVAEIRRCKHGVLLGLGLRRLRGGSWLFFVFRRC